jgi:hypothetical protein
MNPRTRSGHTISLFAIIESKHTAVDETRKKMRNSNFRKCVEFQAKLWLNQRIQYHEHVEGCYENSSNKRHAK